MNLQLYKRIYLNSSHTEEFPIEDTLIFDDTTILAYSSLTQKLARIFWWAAYENQQKIRSHPKHVRILVPYSVGGDFKSQSHFKNTPLDTLEWFISNSVEPPGGLIVSIYFYENLYPGIDNPYNAWCIWPLKQRWSGNGDYVTVQKIPNFSYGTNGHNTKVKDAIDMGHWDLIQNIEKYCPYPVKTIEYGDEETAVNLLKRSKLHFAYVGGSYYLAPMVDTPTVVYGMNMFSGPRSKSIFDMKTKAKDRKEQKKRINYEESFYNSNMAGGAQHTPSRVFHFDLKSNLCIQKPQTCIRHAWDKEELLGYITFSKELNIVNRDRKDWTNLNDLPNF